MKHILLGVISLVLVISVIAVSITAKEIISSSTKYVDASISDDFNANNDLTINVNSTNKSVNETTEKKCQQKKQQKRKPL